MPVDENYQSPIQSGSNFKQVKLADGSIITNRIDYLTENSME